MRILQALSEGADGKELARVIGQSRGTAEADVRVLFKKLDARSRHHLVAQAYRLGLLEVVSTVNRISSGVASATGAQQSEPVIDLQT